MSPGERGCCRAGQCRARPQSSLTLCTFPVLFSVRAPERATGWQTGSSRNWRLACEWLVTRASIPFWPEVLARFALSSCFNIGRSSPTLRVGIRQTTTQVVNHGKPTVTRSGGCLANPLRRRYLRIPVSAHEGTFPVLYPVHAPERAKDARPMPDVETFEFRSARTRTIFPVHYLSTSTGRGPGFQAHARHWHL